MSEVTATTTMLSVTTVHTCVTASATVMIVSTSVGLTGATGQNNQVLKGVASFTAIPK